MKRSIRLAVLALGAAAALVAVAVAYAAYTSPTLRVSYAGTTTNITASASQNDDATAVATIYIPTGTTITTSQAPGTQIGTVKAQVQALALGGALLPLDGKIIVAPPGAIPAAAQAACTQGQTPTASWLLVLTAAGQTINLPAYIIPTAGAETALGPAKLTFCLAPPDVPVAAGGATFGAKFLSAALSVDGVFSPVAQGRGSPSGHRGRRVTARSTRPEPSPPGGHRGRCGDGEGEEGRSRRDRVRFRHAGWPGATWRGRADLGRERQGCAPAARRREEQRKGRVLVQGKERRRLPGAGGRGSTAAPPLCTLLTAQLGGIPCVNPTANGFTAKSRLVRKR